MISLFDSSAESPPLLFSIPWTLVSTPKERRGSDETQQSGVEINVTRCGQFRWASVFLCYKIQRQAIRVVWGIAGLTKSKSSQLPIACETSTSFVMVEAGYWVELFCSLVGGGHYIQLLTLPSSYLCRWFCFWHFFEPLPFFWAKNPDKPELRWSFFSRFFGTINVLVGCSLDFLSWVLPWAYWSSDIGLKPCFTSTKPPQLLAGREKFCSSSLIDFFLRDDN